MMSPDASARPRARLTEWAACLPAGQSRWISLDKPAGPPLT